MRKQNLSKGLATLVLSLSEKDILALIKLATDMNSKELTYDTNRRSKAAKQAWTTRKRNIAAKIASRRDAQRAHMEAKAQELKTS